MFPLKGARKSVVAKRQRWDSWTSPTASRAASQGLGKRARLNGLSPEASSVKRQASKKSGQQVFLDFGQKHFERKTCSKCGMMYAPGVESDESAHKTFCRRANHELGALAEAGLPPKSLRTEWIRTRFQDDKECVVLLPRGGQALKSTLVKFVHEYKERVIDPEMGFADSIEGWVDSPMRWNLIYIADNKIAGLLTLERVSQKQHSWINLSSASLKPALGVLQIWVSPSFRRKNIARRMLDCGRAHCIYGFLVPRQSIAFSQPTSEGRAFAAAYTGVDSESDVCVYSLLPKKEVVVPKVVASSQHEQVEPSEFTFSEPKEKEDEHPLVEESQTNIVARVK